MGEAFAGAAQLLPFSHSLAQGRRPASAESAEAPRVTHSGMAPGRRRRQPGRHSADEARRRAAAAAAATAAEERALSGIWVRETKPLRKPATGWGFAGLPAAQPVYGDRRAFERRLNASVAGLAGNATADGTGLGQRGSEPERPTP